MRINKNNQKEIFFPLKSKPGFTLLEMMVVVGVFGILMVVSVEIFINLYNIGQKTNVSRNLTQDLRQAIETISRDVRGSTELLVYPSTNEPIYLGEIHVKRQDDSSLIYACEDSSGNKCSATTPGSIVMKKKDLLGNITEVLTLTKSETKVTEFDIIMTTSFSSGHPHMQQPRVRFKVMARSDYRDRAGANSQISIWTTASQRKNDITYCDIFECEPSLYTVVTVSNADTYKYDITSDKWTYAGNRQLGSYSGASLSYFDNRIYSPRGSGMDFWVFDVDLGTWTRKADAPFNFKTGSDSAAGNGYVYANTGESIATFGRYDILNDSWSTLADIPFIKISSGFTLQYINDKIYALQSSGERGFAVYDIESNSWSLLASLPDPTAIGCLIPYQDKIYSVSWTNRLRYYDISTNTWSAQISTVPFSASGCDIHNDRIYFVTSNWSQVTQFWSYDITNNTWESKADLPTTSANPPIGIVKWDLQ